MSSDRSARPCNHKGVDSLGWGEEAVQIRRFSQTASLAVEKGKSEGRVDVCDEISAGSNGGVEEGEERALSSEFRWS